MTITPKMKNNDKTPGAPSPEAPRQTVEKETSAQKPLQKNNFIIMAIAGAMIILGFLLMLGAPSTVDSFNPDIFSSRRIVVGPAIAFLGFVLMAVGIIVRPKNK